MKARAISNICSSRAGWWSAVAFLGLSASPLSAQTFAITGGRVVIGDGSATIRGGTVVVRDGRVVAAGRNIAIPSDAERIDATGKWVTPGIVAGFSRLGLTEVDLGVEGADDTDNGASPFSAAIDVAPSVNPRASTIAVSRADGVTRAIVAPATGRSIFAGQGAVIDTGEDMSPITRARAFQFVELGETGAERAGGSRSSAFLLFRNALREARELSRFDPPIRGRGRAAPPNLDPNESRLLSRDASRSDDVLLTRFDAAALVPVLRGRQMLLVHVERGIDILNVIQLRREFPALKLALVGVSEGWTVASELAASGVWVVGSALNDLPGSFEQLAATQSNIARMRAAGVKVAIGMIDDNDSRYQRNQRQYAGNLVALSRVPGADGLSWSEAFAMISSRPAEAFGMGGQIGSLAAGRRGDVVIWSGDPLENVSTPEAVWIDGVRQRLDNHQTKLRDRYKDLERGNLPEAYRR